MINFCGLDVKSQVASSILKRRVFVLGLVSVDVPVEATLAQEVEERLGRLNTNSKQPRRKPPKVKAA